ncbi:hypothetical protein KPL26_01925 [Clostridium algidicarnis]|uniref:hypothetical protein n=1 Tax=Clostridium algidicarnis TaxID=37659 RepID=UPI001C0E8B9F|nr:hypothetical protein [Clostridium algidicarnis]MBU3195419.1 hypothetical protein [Clostridium algidicarnis]
MDFVINKIIDIDKDAENYRKNIMELIDEKQMELEESIKSMNKDCDEELKSKKMSILSSSISDAENKAKDIKIEKEKQLSVIREIYETNKVKIIDEIFNEIIHSL